MILLRKLTVARVLSTARPIGSVDGSTVVRFLSPHRPLGSADGCCTSFLSFKVLFLFFHFLGFFRSSLLFLFLLIPIKLKQKINIKNTKTKRKLNDTHEIVCQVWLFYVASLTETLFQRDFEWKPPSNLGFPYCDFDNEHWYTLLFYYFSTKFTILFGFIPLEVVFMYL